MKVKCTKNEGQSLTKEQVSLVKSYWPNILTHTADNTPITIGKEYLVYGLRWIGDVLWVYVLDDFFEGIHSSRCYPIKYPIFFFEITDPTLSEYWIARSSNEETTIDLGFPEWVNGQFSYERLLNDDATEQEKFGRMIELLQNEFPEQTPTPAQP